MGDWSRTHVEEHSIGGSAVIRMRPLSKDETRVLYKIQHRAKCGIARMRATMILSASRRVPCPAIARQLGFTPQYVRQVIRAFGESGLSSVSAQYRGGCKPKFSDSVRRQIIDLTLCRPQEIGFPWSQWSLSKLVEGIIKRGIVDQISCETVRRILKANSIRFQRTKTWKESKDPEFQQKWQRVKALYRQNPPIDTAVLCIDEFGPIELRPYAGDHWAPEKHPQRLPATYSRHHGVRQLLAYYDVHADVLDGRVYERKRGEELLDFLQWVRERYGEKRLIIVLDNFAPHRRKDVREWAETNRVELVFIATNASWMNRFECHFAALKKFVLGGSYPKSHDECATAIREYLDWRNTVPTHEAILKAQRRVRVA